MGNTLFGDTTMCYFQPESRNNTAQPVPDFTGNRLEWNFWKTNLKASLQILNTLKIIETADYQNTPENI